MVDSNLIHLGVVELFALPCLCLVLLFMFARCCDNKSDLYSQQKGVFFVSANFDTSGQELRSFRD